MKHELYKTKEEIENWLHQYKIYKYKLIEDKEYGFVVNVNESIYLRNKKLKEIKVKFNIINGYFDCSFNELKSLYGSPKQTEYFFDCSNNKITTLKNGPEIVGGFFMCIHNKLKTLKYCPKEIGDYINCSTNDINTIKYIPLKIGNNINNNVFLLRGNSKLKEIQFIEDRDTINKISQTINLNQKLNLEIKNNTINNTKYKL